MTAVTVAALHVAVAWYPFHIERPRYVRNEVRRSSDGATFRGASILRASGNEHWFAALIGARELHVALRARSHNRDQFGPARLLSISTSLRRTSLVVGQQGRALEVRVRHSDGDRTSTVTVPELFATDAWHDIFVSLGPSLTTVAINDREVAHEPIDSSPLANWPGDVRLALGNDANYGREWQGELARADASFDGQRVDLLATIETPGGYWPILQDRLAKTLSLELDHHWTITLARLVSAVPFAWALLVLSSRRFTVVAAAAFLLLVNAAKVAFAGRHPSLLDALVQLSGVFVVALASR